MTARRLMLVTLSSLCALVGVLALGGVSAQAALIHDYLSQITEVPASSGVPFTGPVSGDGAMTVDSGHLWVAEFIEGTSGMARVDQFDAATGAFVSQLPQIPSLSYLSEGVAVAHGTGDVYVGGDEHVAGKPEGVVAVFSAAGGLLGVWNGANAPGAKAFGCFDCDGAGDVAVDNSVAGPAAGAVYVLSPELHVVDVFKNPEAGGKEPLEENVAQLKGTCPVEGTTCEEGEVVPFSSPSRVAVDASTGDVLVLDSVVEEGVGRAVVDVFKPELLGGYEFVRRISGPTGGVFTAVRDIAVDGTSGELYVAEDQERVVYQFSSTGVYLGRMTGVGSPFGDFNSPRSVAVDPESHRVYVGDRRETGVTGEPSTIDVFGPDLVIPDVLTGPATGVTPRSATLTGTVTLDKEGEATCRFVWGTTKEFAEPPAPCSTPATQEESPVEATLSQANGSQLEPDTTYYYRLQATNKNGTNPGEPSQDQEFVTVGPGIHEESVSNVASSSVTFDARINPHNAPASSYFQYGTSSAYGTNVPGVPGLPLGSGEGDVEAIPQHVQGLSPETVYHYRVVVISEPVPGQFEEFDGPDQTFTTQRNGGALELPDGRSWEMVTPSQKQGALFGQIARGSLIQASAAGDAIVDLASQPTEAEVQGYYGGEMTSVSVLSTRGLDGWSSQAIAPPHKEATGVAVGNGGEYRFFSEDLSLGVVHPFGNFTALSPEASESTTYLRTDYSNGDVSAHCQNSCYQPLVTAANTPPGTVFGEEPDGKCKRFLCGPEFVGGTPDLSHIIIKSPVSLTAGSVGEFYEWAGGKLTSTDGVGLGSDNGATVRHAISNDGSRIVGLGESEGLKGLLMRDMVNGKSVRLDLPQGVTATPSQTPVLEYMTASSDDSRIFFLNNERLTAESSASGNDLYEYDLNAPLGSRLTDLTVDKHVGEVANVTVVLGASEDGSYVYFAADGALAPGAVHGTCGGNTPSPGDRETCNLYVAHGGGTTLIAALSAEDFPDWERSLTQLPVRVSPNGRWLAFTSNRSLTGYDTRDAVSGRPDEEVYLYDASSNRLVCASCNPTGARPAGVEYSEIDNKLAGANEIWARDTWIAANVPPWTTLDIGTAQYQSRYLSDSGRLFFDSSDALIPQDVNGTEDVYEYEPVGVPKQSAYECSKGSVSFSERSGGCLGLISSGTSPEESAFLDASVTGGDVFFLTVAKLAPQDFDAALDVYDAHECVSGSPCFSPAPVSPPACSTGDSCKPAPSPQPVLFGSPSSATFSGAGNVTSASVPVLRSRSLTRVQRLARALKACRKKHGHGQRSACKRKARQRYGAKRSRGANATKRGGR
jgi:WD40-like Beta Propeller Repeat